ncbi:hypothetical protein [Gilvimarinus chinensis]|uniref:hypothetical protein n=1 Tax=Gilvimarinus chinensis TaxID=396005 RepID=UPI0003A5E5E2|nr:hypothetical protein [Gilvimarinus chinensis]
MTQEDNPTSDIYGAIGRAYAHFNGRLFDGQLPACLFVLQRPPGMMGYVSQRRWVNDAKQYVDELAINPSIGLGTHCWR